MDSGDFITKKKEPLSPVVTDADAVLLPEPKAPTLDIGDIGFRTNSRGLIEGFEKSTGRIISMQSSMDDILFGKEKNIIKYETPEGTIYVERGINPDAVIKAKITPYSQLLVDMLCEYMIEGYGVKDACQLVGISYRTFCHWRRENEEFRQTLEDLRKDRAELYHDKVLEVAEKGSNDTNRDKLHVDALKWAAEKGDSEKFGAKTKITGDKNAPITFVIDTGIRKDELPTTEREVGEVDKKDEELEKINMFGDSDG